MGAFILADPLSTVCLEAAIEAHAGYQNPCVDSAAGRLRRMGVFGQDGAAAEWRGRHETVRIEPRGADSLRVRGTVRQSVRDDLPGALLPSPPPPGARTVITPDLAPFGDISATSDGT